MQGNKRRRGIKAYAPKVARARDEGWWVVVGCYQTDELLAIKRVHTPAFHASTHSFLAYTHSFFLRRCFHYSRAFI